MSPSKGAQESIEISSKFYKALDSTKKQIRLVTISPGKPNSPIGCSLQIASLDSKPSYEALSYGWGSPKALKTIRLNGHKFSTRRNLWHALYHLRSEEVEKSM